jgi:hypothetical protein
MSQDGIAVDCIRKETTFSFAKRGLVRVGIGSHYDGTLSETFQTRKVVFDNVDEARAYFITLFNDYIAPFNSDKRFSDRPFSCENTSLQITFLTITGKPQEAPNIARIRNEGERIIAYSYTGSAFVPISDEPFR